MIFLFRVSGLWIVAQSLTKFYTEFTTSVRYRSGHGVFLKWIVLRELHRDVIFLFKVYGLWIVAQSLAKFHTEIHGVFLYELC